MAGKQYKCTANTRSWQVADEKRADLQRKLDAGEMAEAPVSSVPGLRQALETHLQSKTSEGCAPATLRKLRFQLGGFVDYLAARSCFFPRDLTAQTLTEYRAGWEEKSGLTKVKKQQNVRGFLRSAGRADLLPALKTIRLSKSDIARLEPSPYSEAEIKTLLAQIPKTFPDSAKAARMSLLIRTMLSTGLAVRDTIQLERSQIEGGYLRLRRQKTNRPVSQKLDGALHAELLAAAGPRYIFWSGEGSAASAAVVVLDNLRPLMQDAGLYIKGAVAHRFRDSFVDWALGNGASVVEVAAMLGDSVQILEKHYKSLVSQRMQDRLDILPRRSWAVATNG